jgi:hypothetical protein
LLTIPGRLSTSFQELFGTPLELAFYVLCLIVLHMVIVHLFYGPPSRRKIRSLNFKRSFLIFVLVTEIVLFSNLLTVEHFSQTMDNNEALRNAHQHVHLYR